MNDPAVDRAVSPVVGIVLLLAITLLLAAVVGAFAIGLDMNRDRAGSLVDGNLSTPTASPTATDSLQTDLVVAENATAGADGVVHSTVIGVGDAAGTDLNEILVDYPKEAVDLETQQDDVVTIGVDTDDDGDLEETFDESDISGANTNDGDSTLTVTFDTAYTVQEGDRVEIRYDAADNPDSPGEYNVSVRLNDAQTVDGTLVVE